MSYWLAWEARRTLRLPSLLRSRIDALVARRLRQVLAAARGSEFYDEQLVGAGDGLSDTNARDLLEGLTPATKQTLTDAGNAALVGGRVRPEWRSSRSSGSTGEPFQVYFDPRCWAVSKYLIKWRGRALAGTRASDRIAVLDAVPPMSPSTNPLAGLGRLRTISLLQPTPRIVERLAEFEPAVIYGPPSALADVADETHQWPGREARRLVFTSGEPLQPLVRRHVETTWDCTVRDVYGTSETKEIAFECSNGALHINEDSVLVEVLNDEGAPVAAGLEGQIVVTSLLNVAMPLLRYATGDRGSLMDGRCDCGLPFRCLGIVSGRSADVLTLGTGTRVSPYALTVAVEGIRGLRRYQILQTARDQLHVKAVTTPDVDRGHMATEIENALSRATSGLAQAKVEFVVDLPRDPNRKFRVVQRSLLEAEA